MQSSHDKFSAVTLEEWASRRRIVQRTASESFESEGRIDECEDAGVRDHPKFM